MSLRVGIAGATGVVGETALSILAQRGFPVGELRLFSSARSAGRRVTWQDTEVVVEELSDPRLRDLDLVLSCVGSDTAREWVPRMVAAGAVVVDNSSAFRQDPGVPLVIPEINPEAAGTHAGIVANPNCTTATVCMAVAPIHASARIAAMTTTSYQSVSGTGREAMEELLDQVRKAVDQVPALRGEEPLDVGEPHVYPHPLAFNLFPHCESFPDGGDTSTEEQKMVFETQKILGSQDLRVHATSVRVPVLVGHSVSVSVSLDRQMPPDEARRAISEFPGVRVLDRPGEAVYPTPLQSVGIDEVLVGRIRRNPAVPNGLSLFACGDNLRKGAALNAVQIAELLFGIGTGG